MGGVVTEIGLLVLQCAEEVLKLEPRPVLTLSHDLAEKTVLERVPTPETATHIPVKVFNISPYEHWPKHAFAKYRTKLNITVNTDIVF